MDNFKLHSYTFDEVRPSQEELHDFLQLGLLEPEHPALVFLEEILPDLNAAHAIKGGYTIFKVEEQNIRQGIIRLQDQTFELGSQVCGYLKDSEYAALFLCTAGPEFTSMADHFTSNGDLLEAYLVDAIGSLTVENAMDRIMAQMEEEWDARGFKITNRYSPGYCNWHLNEQKKIFSLLDGHSSGVELTDSCLMLPRKSVSGIIGLGSKARKRDYGCETCNNTTCIYRKILHKEK